jgi:hypothetical protein
MSEAIAHYKQLRDLGCSQTQAIRDTCVAFAITEKEFADAYFNQCVVK